MADTPTSHNFVPQDDYNVRLCGICGYSKSQHTTKPIAESGWSKDLSILADGDYFSRVDEYDKWPTLIRLENGAVYEMGQGGNLRREYAAEDYEYLGPFSVSDFEQLIQLRKLGIEARDVLALLVPYGKIHTVEGVRYPDGSHSEAVDRGERVLNELRAIIGKEWEGEALTPKGEQS